MLLATLFTTSMMYSQQQQRHLDSLSAITRSLVHDTIRLQAYGDLCYEYRFVDQDSAFAFGRAGIRLGQKIGHQPGLAQVLSDAAFIYYDRGQYDSAVILWSSALAIRSALRDKQRTASLHMKIGGARFRAGEYEDALMSQLSALRLYEEMKMPQGIGQALNNAAAVYQAQNLLEEALSSYQKALALHRETGNMAEQGTTLINLGNVYFLQKLYPKAKAHYLRSLLLLKGNDQPANYAIGLNNLSEIYVVDGYLDSASHFSRMALALREKIGDSGGIISSLNMLGRIETRRKNYAQAQDYLTTALQLATAKRMLPEEERVQLNLFELFRQQGNWKKALDAHVRFAGIRDTLLNETGRKEIASLQVKYETAKKEQQIRLHEASLAESELRIQRDRVIMIALSVVIVLFLVILALLRSRQQRKAEAARQENEIRIREAFIQATIESQENERKRFARDLHDGMGQWLSSLRLSLTQIQNAGSDEDKLVVLERAEHILKEINNEFRGIAFNLMPYTLIHHGLAAALDEMAARLNRVDGARFALSSFGFPERMTEIAEISLYRIVQEWTNNIIKYGHADHVQIQLTGHDDELIIMIEDNGRGFDTNVLYSGGGNGWKNMQSRINLVRGKIEIDSTPGLTGTTLTIRVPGSVIWDQSAAVAGIAIEDSQ